MARRRGRRRGGRKSKAIPLAPVLPIVLVGIRDFSLAAGEGLYGKANRFVEDITGYNIITGAYDYKQALPLWLGTAAGIMVHKVASKTVNRYVRKLTMGYLVI